MTSIEEINKEIQRLTSYRQQYFEEQYKDIKKKFLELEWLKGVTFSFIESCGAYGHREYVLRGFLPNKEFARVFDSGRTLTLMGNSKNYMDNITVRRSDNIDSLDSIELYTCNAEMFKSLLKTGLKVSLPFDFKNKLSVYKALDEMGSV